MMPVRDRIAARRDTLTPGERRVAEIVLDDPQAVAFGTVASVAERAGTSGPTVLRMASKLGLDGFVGLQAAVQEELAARLRPAAERIRQRPAPDPLARALEAELENVHATLGGIDPEVFARAVLRLAVARRRVGILSGEATFGVAHLFADMLGLLREGVELLAGSPVRVVRRLAVFEPDDTLVVVDLRRYERWVLDTMRNARQTGLHVIGVTDGLLSPVAEGADEVFVVDAAGAGPFDSHVGTLALCNALAAGVAARLRRTAAKRLDRVEGAWRRAGTLSEM
jgi:DNA-binding MurR/RpiR family transcriptional regulator